MESYITIAQLAYQTFQIPIYIYHSGTLNYFLPNQKEYLPPIQYVQPILTQDNLTFFTDYHACFCKLLCQKDTETVFLLGPVSPLSYSNRELKEMHQDYLVLQDRRKDFDDFFSRIPSMTYIDFFHILRIIYYMINTEEIPLDTFLKEIYTPESVNNETTLQEYASSLLQTKEYEQPNNSYLVENELLSIIRNGDLDKMKHFIANVPAYHGGTVANDALRMQKNYFISSLTLATRTAIDVGIPSADAYQLSDLYIRRLESLTSMNAVNQLFTNALLDFTTLVQKHQQSAQTSYLDELDPLVNRCIQYVKQHTNQPLSVQSIADALGYHRTYLSSLFSETMGFHLNDYIYRCKLEESKALLTYTDKPISEISSYLCFSSQSHFQLRFKKAFQMTPAQYRKKYLKLS